MIENLKKFMEMVSSDKELKQKVLEINSKYKSSEENKEKLIELAKEYGVVLKKEDFVPKSGLLDDSALEAACGGHGMCVAVGGSKKCGCVLGGAGGDEGGGEVETLCFFIGV